MSVSVKVRCKKAPAPKRLFESLSKNSEFIVYTSCKYPTLKFGIGVKSLRGIEVNKEADGLEVRVCSFSSVADYQLFGRTIKTLMDLTGAKAFYEDDDECEIADPMERFDEAWIEGELESSLNACRALNRHFGAPVVMRGLFMDFCVGTLLYLAFGIALQGEYEKDKMDKLLNHLITCQWYLHIEDKQDTSSRLKISDKNGKGRPLSLSLITIRGNKVQEFDYISYADLFGLIDMDTKEQIIIPFKYLWKILPDEVFHPFDDYQCEKKGDFTVDMARQMISNGKLLQPDDLHFRPTYPGEGFDKRQNTFILMWDPAISGTAKLEEYVKEIPRLIDMQWGWSVWDYKGAKWGDRFFMVRVGEGKTGIVMSGVFESNPYEGEDWRGEGRETHYMELRPNFLLDPEAAPMITTEELAQEIPSFDWTGGHSGRILQQTDARKLEKMWHKFLEEHDEYDGKTMNRIYG